MLALPVVLGEVAVSSALPECSRPPRAPMASRARASALKLEPTGRGMRLLAVPLPSTTDLCSKPVEKEGEVVFMLKGIHRTNFGA